MDLKKFYRDHTLEVQIAAVAVAAVAYHRYKVGKVAQVATLAGALSVETPEAIYDALCEVPKMVYVAAGSQSFHFISGEDIMVSVFGEIGKMADSDIMRVAETLRNTPTP